MNIDSTKDFVSKATRYAGERWSLDDAELVREWCERRTDSDTPEALVDALATKYDLIDPQDEAGAARAARQLLDEYRDVLGPMREELLARLPS